MEWALAQVQGAGIFVIMGVFFLMMIWEFAQERWITGVERFLMMVVGLGFMTWASNTLTLQDMLWHVGGFIFFGSLAAFVINNLNKGDDQDGSEPNKHL